LRELEHRVFGDAMPRAFAAAVDGTTYQLTIGLSGGDRALLRHVSTESALAYLAKHGLPAEGALEVWTYESFSVKTGTQGTWLCDNGVLEPCSMMPPGCAVNFQGPVHCVSNGAIFVEACGLVAQDRPTPVVVSSSCAPLVVSLTAKFAGDELVVSFGVDEAQFYGRPAVEFILMPVITDLFGWSSASAIACSAGVTCAYDPARQGLVVLVSNVAADGAFTVSSVPAHWARASQLNVNATINGLPALASGVPSVFSLPPFFVDSIDADVNARFALTDPLAGPAGTLVVVVTSTGGTPLLSSRGAYEQIHLTIPSYWALGASCTVRSRSNADTTWLLSVEHVVSSVETHTSVILLQPSSVMGLDQAIQLFIICPGVVAAAGDTIDGVVSVGFEGPGASFLADAIGSFLLTVKPSEADNLPLYVQFQAAVVAVATTLTVSELRPRLLGTFSSLPMAFQRTESGDVITVTIGLTGAQRVYQLFLSDPAALISLCGDVLSQPLGNGEQWTYVTGSVLTGVQGLWRCAGLTCALFPPGCSATFQAPVECLSNGTPNSAACGLIVASKPVAQVDSSACVPVVTFLNVDYSADMITVTFEVDETQFLGAPTLSFSLQTDVASLFEWDTPTPYVIVVDVPIVTSNGFFTVPSRPRRWARLPVVTVGVTLSTSTHSVLSTEVKTAFMLPNFNVDTIEMDSRAFFAPSSPPDIHTGTLVLDFSSPLSRVSSRGFYDNIHLDLPTGWHVGASCIVSSRAENDFQWPLRHPNNVLAAAFVPGPSTATLSLSGALGLDTVRNILVVCRDVVPSSSETAAASIQVRFEGLDHAYLAEVALGPVVSYAPATADAFPMFVYSEFGTVNVPEGLTPSQVEVPVFGVFSGLHLALEHLGGTIGLTIGLSGADRALLPLLFDSTAVSSLGSDVLTGLGGTWTYQPASLESGIQGTWMCDDSSDGHQPCVVTPPGCGDAFQGAVDCVSNGTASVHACGLVASSKPAPSPESDDCVPVVTYLTAVHADSTLSIAFSVDTSQFVGRPALKFSLRVDVVDLFPWASPTCSHPCFFDFVQGALTVVIDSVAADGRFTVDGTPLRWAKTPELVVGVTLASSMSTNVLAPCVVNTFSLPTLLVDTVTGVTPVATFAPYNISAGPGGKLVISVTADSSGVTMNRGAFASLRLSLPPGWSLGTLCTVRVRTAGDAFWYYDLPSFSSRAVDPAGLVTVTTPELLSHTQAVYLVCENVVPPSSPSSGGIGVSFEGPTAAFLVELSASAPIAYDASTADASALFVRFVLTASHSDAEYLPGDISIGLFGSDDTPLPFDYIRTEAVYDFTIGLDGGNRAMLTLLSAEAALASLASDVLSSTDDVWTLDAVSIKSGVQGVWLCGDGAGYLPCEITPTGCGIDFQGPVTCVSRNTAFAEACGLVMSAKPSPTMETDMCVQMVTSLSAGYASGVVTVTFGIDPSQFIGSPSLTVTLSSTKSALFAWQNPMACSSACEYSDVIDAVVVTLSSVTAGGSFTIPSPPSKWATGVALNVQVSLSGSLQSIVADGVPVSFPLPVINVFTIGSATSTVVFAPSSASSNVGTLLMLVSQDASTPLLTSVSAPVASIVSTLPAGWALGSVCEVRARSAGQARWMFLLPSISPTKVHANGTISIPSELLLNSVSEVLISCNGVTAVSGAGPVAVDLAFDGASDAFRAFAPQAPGLAYDSSAWASKGDFYVGFRMSVTGDSSSIRPNQHDNLLTGSVATIKSKTVVASGIVTMTIGLAGGSRAYFAVLSGELSLADLATALTAADSASGLAWSFITDSVEHDEQGSYLCGTAQSGYTECVSASGCGLDFSTPQECVLGGTAFGATHMCAFAPIPAAGLANCGAWQCKSTAGSFVSCTNPAVCIDGCAENVPITVNTATSEHLTTGRFKQFCVRAGAEVDAAVYCPPEVVPPAAYAPTCNAVTSCVLGCRGTDGNSHSCDSGLAWSVCNADCGNGQQTRNVYCSGSLIPWGQPVTATNTVSVALCPMATFPMAQPCSGSGCARYEWRCITAGNVLSSCTLTGTDVGFSGCAGTCGLSTQTRTVVCASYSANGTLISRTTDERLCVARQAKPITTKSCASTDCSDASWGCYALGADPLKPSDCSGGFGFVCPTTGCSAASVGQRGVACYGSSLSVRLDASKCAGLTKPAAERACASVDTSCVADFRTSNCQLAQGDALVPAAVSCVPSLETAASYFRQGTCVNATGSVVTGACAPEKLRVACQLPICATSGQNVTFSWNSAQGACLPGCKAYAPVDVTCRATTGTAPFVVVEPEFCVATTPKPPVYASCTAVPCVSGATCVAKQVFIGITPYSDISAQCKCPVGRGGPQCTLDTALLSVSVNVAAGSISWSFVGGDPTVAGFVSLGVRADISASSTVLATTTLPSVTLLGIVPADENFDSATGFSTHFGVDFTTFPPGPYSAVVTVVMNNGSTKSTPFTLTAACILNPAMCLNGSTCNASTGACMCTGGFSGPQCGTSPCSTLNCNLLTSSCDLTTPSTAQCVCSSGFTGPRCNSLVTASCTRDSIEGVCANGSDREALVQQGSPACGACQCLHPWTGVTCNTCSLQCRNGGTPASDCSRCDCPVRFHGVTCEQLNAVLTLNFRVTSDLGWYVPTSPGFAAALSQWATVLQKSIDALVASTLRAGQTSTITTELASHRAVTDINGDDFVQVKLRFNDDLPASTLLHLFSVYDALKRIREFFVGTAVTNPDSPVYRMPAFNSLYLDRGVGMKDPDCSSAAAETSCPVGTLFEAEFATASPVDPQDPQYVESNSSSFSDLSLPEKIGICAGVGIAAAILLLLSVLCIRNRCGSRKRTSTVSFEPSPTKATADV